MDHKNKIKIQTEGTPNPNALKFVLDKTITEGGTYNFPNKEKAKGSPLATRLFNIESIKEVFLGNNFITISKVADVNWDDIYDKLIDSINKHFESGEPIVSELKFQSQKTKTSKDSVEDKIKEILDNQIRPAVASDGGDIIFDSYEDGVLRLHLQGACSSCPSSIMTLKAGVERMLKSQIPELKEVISV